MSIHRSPTIITGNTYSYRDVLRALGGRWDAEAKAWRLPPLSMRERSQLPPLRGCDVRRA